LGDGVRGLGVPEATGGLRTTEGRYLVRVDDRSGILVLHRSALIDLLAAKVDRLRIGVTVSGVTLTAAGPGRLVTDQGEITADLIELSRNVLQHDVYDLVKPLPAYHAGPVALVGDAAHAMTPDLRQGGCQAIEDGVVLAQTLGARNVRDRLPAYTSARLKRTV